MNDTLRKLLAPRGLWPLALLLTLALVALAAAFSRCGTLSQATGNPIRYADGTPLPDGHWSVLCIDGVTYLEITTPQGPVILPKHRRNGLIAACSLPAGE